MRKITIGNTTMTKEVIVSIDENIAEMFPKNGINIGAAKVSVNGYTLGCESTLRELGFTDDGEDMIYVYATIDTKNAH